MFRIVHLVLVLCLLVTAFAWSSDGHATMPNDHAKPAIEMPADNPDNPSPQPDCDHHCHFGSHVLGLVVTQTWSPAIGIASVFDNQSSRYSDHAPSRPERPPSC